MEEKEALHALRSAEKSLQTLESAADDAAAEAEMHELALVSMFARCNHLEVGLRSSDLRRFERWVLHASGWITYSDEGSSETLANGGGDARERRARRKARDRVHTGTWKHREFCETHTSVHPTSGRRSPSPSKRQSSRKPRHASVSFFSSRGLFLSSSLSLFPATVEESFDRRPPLASLRATVARRRAAGRARQAHRDAPPRGAARRRRRAHGATRAASRFK